LLAVPYDDAVEVKAWLVNNIELFAT